MNIPILIIIVGIFFMIWASRFKQYRKKIIVINIVAILLYSLILWAHFFSEMDKGKGDMSWMLLLITFTVIHIVLLLAYVLSGWLRNIRNK